MFKNSGFNIQTDSWNASNSALLASPSNSNFITPPARQIERLENKQSWFLPEKKPRKQPLSETDSELKEVAKRLNFNECGPTLDLEKERFSSFMSQQLRNQPTFEQTNNIQQYSQYSNNSYNLPLQQQAIVQESHQLQRSRHSNGDGEQRKNRNIMKLR